jgi:hypothetical protein
LIIAFYGSGHGTRPIGPLGELGKRADGRVTYRPIAEFGFLGNGGNGGNTGNLISNLALPQIGAFVFDAAVSDYD